LHHPDHHRIRVVISRLIPLLMVLLVSVITPDQASADATFLCNGEPLSAEVHNGAVDASGIPNSNAGTVPGAFIVIRWGQRTLQLPRTNNAGIPSYSDGRWWWQAIDPDHPDLAELKGLNGAVKHYNCEPQA
jgi:hypothetical protein